MTIRVSDLLAQATFPLFAIHPRSWDGDAYVGDVNSGGMAGAGCHFVQLVYEKRYGDEIRAAAVSNLDGAAARAHGWVAHGQTIAFHLTPFVARFDARYVVKKVRPRKFDPFPLSEFQEQSLVAELGTETVGASWWKHRSLPVQLLRFAVRRGDRITDVAVAGWNVDPRMLSKQVEQVDLRFAHEFDAMTDPAYPPPEWSDPGQT